MALRLKTTVETLRTDTDRRAARRLPQIGAVLVGCVLMTVVLAHLSRGLTFFFDEWDFLLRRRTLSVDALLAPHNGHLSAVPAAMFMGLSRVFGARTYTPYLCLVFALHVACTLLMFRCAARHAGPVAATFLATLLLTLGRAWQDLLWPFQSGFLFSLAAGLGALLCMEGDRPRRLLAALCLIASLASSGLGVPVLAAVASELVLRRRWRLLLEVTTGPAVVYGLWYLSYGTSEVSWSNAHLVPDYVGRAASGAVGGVIGVDSGRLSGLVAAGIALAIVVVAARRSLSPRLCGALVGALGFWGLTALARGPFGEPTASRYLYPGAIFVLLTAAELLGRVPPLRLGSPAAAIAITITVLACASNLDRLRGGAAGLRETSAYVRAELGVLELAGQAAAPEFQPDPARMPQVSAGPYFEAVRDLGSPADDVAAIRRRPPLVRQAADDVLRRIIASGATRSAASGPAAGECHEQGPSRWAIRADRGVAELQSDDTAVALWLRQFGTTFGERPLLLVPAGQRLRIDFNSLADPLMPQLELESAGRFWLCAGKAVSAR